MSEITTSKFHPKKRIDIVAMAVSVYSKFHSGTIPQKFYENSKVWKNKTWENKKLPSMTEMIESIRERVLYINEKHNLRYTIKSYGYEFQLLDVVVNYDECTVMGDEDMIMYLELDEEANINRLYCQVVRVDEDGVPERGVAGKNNILDFLEDIENLILYVVKCGRFIAENYQENTGVNYDKALSLTLEALGIKRDMQEAWLSYDDKIRYSDFRYFQLENSESHDTTTKFYLINWELFAQSIYQRGLVRY